MRWLMHSKLMQKGGRSDVQRHTRCAKRYALVIEIDDLGVVVGCGRGTKSAFRKIEQDRWLGAHSKWRHRR